MVEFDKKSKIPPTAFFSDLKEDSPILIMMRSSFGPIFENFNYEGLSLTFLRTLVMFLRSEILAELFLFDMVNAV